MKLTYEVVIEADRRAVWALFDDRDKLQRWQPALQSVRHVSGEPGRPGAVTELTYNEGVRKVVVTETITERRQPDFVAATYAAPYGVSLIVNRFEETDGDATRWSVWCNTRFRGLMKAMALFIGGSLRRRTESDMQRFKLLVESEAATQ